MNSPFQYRWIQERIQGFIDGSTAKEASIEIEQLDGEPLTDIHDLWTFAQETFPSLEFVRVDSGNKSTLTFHKPSES